MEVTQKATSVFFLSSPCLWKTLQNLWKNMPILVDKSVEKGNLRYQK